MKNTVTVIGNLGKGYKFTENAPSLFGGTTAKITYSVAERNGEDTTWYQVSALGAKATAAKALFDAHPGCRVEISGDFNPGEGEIDLSGSSVGILDQLRKNPIGIGIETISSWSLFVRNIASESPPWLCRNLAPCFYPIISVLNRVDRGSTIIR